MIKTIASNIDELLVRYDNQKDQVGVVYSNSSQSHVTASQTGYSEDPQAVDMIIRRIERLESDRFRPQQRFRGRANRSSFGNSRPQERCQHCSFINRQLGSSLNTNHKSATCGKKRLSVNVIESTWDAHELDENCDYDEDIPDNLDDGEKSLSDNIYGYLHFQNEDVPSRFSSTPINLVQSSGNKIDHFIICII